MSEWRTFYRVALAFKWGARTFRRGEIVRADDPLVEQVNRARPDLLHVTVERIAPDSRRPVEVAGTRSSPEPRPSRDWLADEPWRIP